MLSRCRLTHRHRDHFAVLVKAAKTGNQATEAVSTSLPSVNAIEKQLHAIRWTCGPAKEFYREKTITEARV